jgi:hypothetical protein
MNHGTILGKQQYNIGQAILMADLEQGRTTHD